jgi:hypothetical protein
MRYLFLIMALLLCQSPLVKADSVDHYVDLALGYSRGDFNSSQETKLSQLQVTYGQVMPRYDFSVSAPYLFLSDNLSDESGWGDIVLRAGIALADKNSSADHLHASIAIKLPTANDTKGLGTGEADLGGFLNYTHPLNKMYITLMGGYIVTGDNLLQSYNDIVVYGAGLSKIITPWYVFGRLDGRQSTLETDDAPLELSGGFFYQLYPTQFLKLEGFAGLSHSSPNVGLTIGFVNWF